MEFISIVMAYIQVPLALIVAGYCGRIGRRVTGKARNGLVIAIAYCAGLVAWRLSTVSVDMDVIYRYGGGMGIQTLAVIVIWAMALALGSMSDQKN